MKHILIVWISLFAVSAFAGEVVPKRSFKIVVAAGAPEPVKMAAQLVLDNVRQNPVLAAFADNAAPSGLTDSAALLSGPVSERAYNHLILVGLPDDPMVKAAWQRDAAVVPGGLYVFGFGHFRGDIGYIESDRNPFLHSKGIKRLPYETEIVTLSGATPAGVLLAAQAFLKHGIVNGVVAEQGWTRPDSALLERSPLSLADAVPSTPEKLGDWTRLAASQASEDEYRGVLDDTGIKPHQIWRIKYFKPGVWDGDGMHAAYDNYSAGLHKRAYGNTLWVAEFSSATEAQQAAPKIAAAAKMQSQGKIWTAKPIPYGGNDGRDACPGDLTLWTRDSWVMMSTLPAESIETMVGKTVTRK